MQELSQGFVMGALSRDHETVDHLLAEVLRATLAAAPERAEVALRELLSQITRHMDFEERILFPVYESATLQEAGQGPTALLRSEHARIRTALGEMTRALGAGSLPALSRAACELEAILPGHNVREERVLHRVVDRVLGPLGALVLAARLMPRAEGNPPWLEGPVRPGP